MRTIKLAPGRLDRPEANGSQSPTVTGPSQRYSMVNQEAK